MSGGTPASNPLGVDIQTAEIDDNAVTDSKIANNAVTDSKIATHNSTKITGIDNLDYSTFDRVATPSNPSSNHGKVYVKQVDTNNDGIFILVKKNNTFTEVQIA